jgi:Asp-tRNA(Asn)/Glu-tRNA(Gln) amidotransferase A subunit family amidase
LTTANTPSSRRAVVPPSTATASSLAFDTYAMSPNDSTVVNRIDTQGVLVVGCTLESERGMTPCLPMP